MSEQDQPPVPPSGGDGSDHAASPPRSQPNSADPVTASQSFVVSSRKTLQGTGFFKPLPTMGRVGRFWAELGLVLGRRLATVLRDDHVYIILMAAVVGVASGAAAGLLLWWIEYAIGLFPHATSEVSLVRWAVVVGVPVMGGVLAGVLRVLSKRVTSAPLVAGVPGVIESIAHRGGSIRGRGALVVGAGTGLTIGSGGSCGHEGPSVAIGAAVGSVLARFFGLRMSRQLAMVGAGCAGGLAAAFNAPLAGVIFTVELVFGGSLGGNVGTMSVFIPLIVSAVSATFTSHAIHGDKLAFGLQAHAAPSVLELGFYVGLAVLAGIIGGLMSKFVLLVERRFEQLSIPLWTKPAVGALGVGLLAALFSNELLGAGHSTVDRALHGELVWQWALILLVLKIVVTALTVGSGGFGGLFMPSLYVGACLGTLVAVVAALVLGPEAQGTGAYAVVGMGAIFAAMMHAPLTPIVMLFELTHDYGIILPLMLSCILSVVVSRRVGRMSFYRQVLEHRGVVLKNEAEGEVMKRGLVRDLMLAPPRVLTEGAELEEVRKTTLDADLRSTFVIDDAGQVVGYINGDQLAHRMLRGEIQPDSKASDLMGQSRLTLLYPHDTLAGAMLAFARSGHEVLPVVDFERRLQGVVRRGDLLGHYSDKVLGEQEEVLRVHSGEGDPDEEVGLGKGLVLERVVVGRAWAGRSLKELDLRGRTGVSVLEWMREHAVVPIDPRNPLKEGDELALCGTREQLLRARLNL